jgi:hypothetical protein
MSGQKWTDHMRKVQEITKQRSSTSSTRGVIEGKPAKKEPSLEETELANKWYANLIKSLRMVYYHDGKWKKAHELKPGDKVTAHPEFDPDVIAEMDKELPRPLANYVYRSAFNAVKPRADAMLKRFEDAQTATNRSEFQNALKRLAVFAPEAAKVIDSNAANVKTKIRFSPDTKEGGTRKRRSRKRNTRKQRR